LTVQQINVSKPDVIIFILVKKLEIWGRAQLETAQHCKNECRHLAWSVCSLCKNL